MVTLITKENIIAFVLALLSNGLLSYVLAVVTLVATVFFYYGYFGYEYSYGYHC